MTTNCSIIVISEGNRPENAEYVERVGDSVIVTDAAGETVILQDFNSATSPKIPPTPPYVAENVANKRCDLLTPNNTTYPTTLAVVTALNTKSIMTGATNGIILINSGSTVALGGILTGNTTINGSGFTLNINNGNLNVNNGYQISGQTILKIVGDGSNIAIGSQALYNNTSGCYNIGNGFKALYCNVSGNSNIAMGYQALSANTIGCNNFAAGYNSLKKNVSGYNNIGIGYQALSANTSNYGNVAIGHQTLANNLACQNIGIGNLALTYNTNGEFNTAIGANSEWCNTIGCWNSAYGVNSLSRNTTGCMNIAIGGAALKYLTGGSFNTAIGTNSMACSFSGCSNVAVGSNTMCSLNGGAQNTAIGVYSLAKLITGNCNISIGHNTFGKNTSGCGNTGVGYGAFYYNLTGNSNTVIGGYAGFCSTGSLNVFIGNCAGYYETTSNKLYVANSSTSNPLIYGEFDNRCLKINGNLNITGNTCATKFIENGACLSDTYSTTYSGIAQKTGVTYTALSVDNGKILEFTNTGATLITLPTGLTTGYNLTIINYGGATSATKSITGGTGTTIKSKGSALNLASQYGAATAYYRGSNTWVLFGDLSS